MSRVWDGGSWEGDFLPSPSSRGDHTLLRRTQGRMVRARESTADNRLPSTALTATSCFAAQPNPPTVPLFTAERLPSFSRVNMHPVSRLSFPVFSLHFSHISLFSLRFPPSLPPLLCSHVCVVHLSLPAPPPSLGWASLAVVSHSHSCLKQSTASAFPIFTFRQHHA